MTIYEERVLKADLERLASHSGSTCVSIYFNTERAGKQVIKGPIKLKNALSEAERQLLGQGLRRTWVKNLLEPAHELLSNEEFWRHQAESLCVFLAPQFNFIRCLPLRLPQITLTGEVFLLKPLLAALDDQPHFYILALSQKNLRLLKGDRFSLKELQDPQLSKTFEAFASAFDFERQLQLHTSQRSGPVHRATAIFHGQGNAGANPSDRKKHLLQFFQSMRPQLQNYLGERSRPLILAAVDYLHPLFAQACKSTTIYEKGIVGNPELTDLQQLHKSALELLEPQKSKEHNETRLQIQQLESVGCASRRVEEIFFAAQSGLIDTLQFSLEAQVWGKYNSENGTCECHSQREEGDWDLLDRIVLNTWEKGGRLEIVHENGDPPTWKAAAIFRAALQQSRRGTLYNNEQAGVS